MKGFLDEIRGEIDFNGDGKDSEIDDDYDGWEKFWEDFDIEN